MKSGDVFFTVVIVLLVILVASLLVLVSAEKLPEWQVPAGEKILDAEAASDGTIYVITGDPATSGGHMFYSVTRDGLTRWGLNVPDMLHLPGTTGVIEGRIISVSSDSVYVYFQWEVPQADLTPESITDNYSYPWSGAFYSISPSGKVLWTIPDYYSSSPRLSMWERNDQIYLYGDSGVIVTDKRGNVRWVVNTGIPPAISSDGYVYTLFSHVTTDQNASQIEAYYPNGTLYWSRIVNNSVIGANLNYPDSDYYLFTRSANWLERAEIDLTVPIYRNDRIYLVYRDEIVTLDRSGKLLWTLPLNSESDVDNDARGRYVPYWPMLFDTADNFYVLQIIDTSTPDLLVISPAGEVLSTLPYNRSRDYRATNGNYVYYVANSPETSHYDLSGKLLDSPDPVVRLTYPVLSRAREFSIPDNLENLSTVSVAWDDVRTGKTVTTVALPIGEVRCATVTTENVDRFFEPAEAHDIRYVNPYNRIESDPLYNFLNTTAPVNFGHVYVDILPSDNITYVSLYTYNTQDPVALGRTPIYYFSAIYALDQDGHILWTKPTDFGADLIDGDNTTVYYSTNDGRIGSAGVYVAGGLTLAGILYAVLKFFSAGLVSRARSRLDQNENRTAVLKFVISHPGSTLREIARGTEMNLGTIRYHMFILGLNHKIVSFQSDGKHVRYFQNSNTYSREEQLVLSLAKRDKMRYLLKKISEQPGMSNRELAQALLLPDSAISRYLKELVGAGVVDRDLRSDGSPAYSIKDDYRKYVESAICGITS